MQKISTDSTVKTSENSSNENDLLNEKLEAKYGLPSEVKFCTRCVYSNQKPECTVEYFHDKDSKKEGIKLDESGVCSACQVSKKKASVNWEDRNRELRELCDEHRSKDGSYDCIVPGSGGKDSFFASHMLKYEYGMNPLTVTWAPHIYTNWGWENFQAWIHSGFDNLLMTPNGRVHRLLTRLATENLFHPFQPFIIGQKGLAPKLALEKNISLVFYGENEGDYGQPVESMYNNFQRESYFAQSNVDDLKLGGVSKSDLEKHYGVLDNDLQPYLPCDPQQIKENNVKVAFLGYYLEWHPQGAYYYSVEHGGFKPAPERSPGTYSKYNSIDDKIDDFFYFTTLTKFGIGRATYDASQEIRHDEITREEGVALVKKFDHEFPERFAEEIFKYLSLPEKEFPIASKLFNQPIMTRDYFDQLTDQFRSPHLWRQEGGAWKLRHTVY